MKENSQNTRFVLLLTLCRISSIFIIFRSTSFLFIIMPEFHISDLFDIFIAILSLFFLIYSFLHSAKYKNICTLSLLMAIAEVIYKSAMAYGMILNGFGFSYIFLDSLYHWVISFISIIFFLVFFFEFRRQEFRGSTLN